MSKEQPDVTIVKNHLGYMVMAGTDVLAVAKSYREALDERRRLIRRRAA